MKNSALDHDSLRQDEFISTFFQKITPSKKCSKNVLIRGEKAMFFSDFQYLSKGGELG